MGLPSSTETPNASSRALPGASPIRRDLWIVAASTLLAFVLAGAFELHETMSGWTSRLERWEVDEIPTALTVLAFGMAWFAFRRRAEADQASQLRALAQEEALRLLHHNRELAQRLIEVQESERRALARELHDELGQSCNAIRVEAAYIQRSSDPAEIEASAVRTAQAAEALYQNVRSLLRRLRPAELDELGLVAALQALGEAWEERSSIACIFHHDGDLDDLGEAVDTAIYRIAQEALSNVIRHAGANQVRIGLHRNSPHQVTLRVEDDGCGFAAQHHTRGLGLLGCSERAAALGGTLHIDSTLGAGTRLHLQVPVAPRPT
jgi:two-component system sensor histidine kinase UhpB